MFLNVFKLFSYCRYLCHGGLSQFLPTIWFRGDVTKLSVLIPHSIFIVPQISEVDLNLWIRDKDVCIDKEHNIFWMQDNVTFDKSYVIQSPTPLTSGCNLGISHILNLSFSSNKCVIIIFGRNLNTHV